MPTPSTPIASTSTQTNLPNIPDNFYSNLTQQIVNGSMTNTDAQNSLKGLISGGQYGGTPDFTRLTPQGQTFTSAKDQASYVFNPDGSLRRTTPAVSTTTANSTTGQVSTTQGQLPTVDQMLAQYKAGGALTTNQMTGATPITTPVTNPLNPPTGITPPTPPVTTSTSAVDTFNQGLAATLDAQKAQLQAGYDQQIAAYQTKIDALNKQQSDLQTLQDNGMLQENNAMQQEVQAKQAALATEQQQFQDQYNTKQNLINEMNGLLTTGNQLVEQMQNTTGLASIQNPRITQTMSDVTARAGVINSLLNAADGQISVAQSQLKTTVDTLTSIANDQINYYQNIVSFYAKQSSDNISQLATLTSDQKTFIDAKLSDLQTTVNNTQATYDYIQKAMVDPATAEVFNKAGVSLTDSIPQINQKLATYQQTEAIKTFNDTMTKAGYSLSKTGGLDTTVKDQYGKTWYKAETTSQANSGNPVSVNYTSTESNALIGAGFTAGQLQGVKSYIDTYGAQAFLDNNPTLPQSAKDAINKIYGL